ncbi:structural maintenance of chromosome protein [Clohesyomyces aquaticus]|uniref:Structural maintenance of chromosomes protein n=1 Tax=Clohesyomyces aquaticus TaxID=1231657 RepID=A0A1Y2ABE1_9PLEO|nr:structural maintenance of chromosome protein [Clohesyomyces aquaticus]
MGKLVQLEVNNFKSYRGHHVLLFGDSYFTSIIGPNGSGKSNSMDAISFVLGIKSSHLRSTNLRDLIYRGRVIRTTKINADGTATEADGEANGSTQNGSTQNGEIQNGDTQTSSQRHDPQSAWVMAVYEDDAEQVHKWKRTITTAGQSEYRIDGRPVTAKQYNEALEEQSILIKARNFLVFQGDVESVASQNPKDLTRLIEQISGSLEYKADYDRLKLEADKAMEDQTSHLTTRRQINAEIKTYQEQKAEAEEYQKRVSERDQAVVTHVLWKLFHFQQTMQESSDEIAKHQEELKEHKRGVEKYQHKLDETKQAQAKVSREVTKTEKAIKGKEKEIEDAQNDLVPIDEKIRISTQDLHKYEERVASLEKERDTQASLIDRYKKDLSTVQKAQQRWEDEFKAAAQQEGRELTAQDLQEYTRLRGDVTKQTQANQIEVNRLSRELKTEIDHANSLKSKYETFKTQVDKLEEEISELQDRRKQLKSQAKAMEDERSTKQQTYNKLQSDRQLVIRQHTELNENLQDTLRKLHEADSGRRQNEKEIKAREAVAQMKRIFGSGVLGRYSDLCRPKQKQYETAVSTLLGWHLDAIIVDTEKTAKDCIQYLKDQKIGQLHFVPLDTITIKAVNPNLKGMHPGMRLGIDCIDYDSSLERAMASACGNSIICDDLKIARYLCYEKKVDAKAVTKDGVVIAKGGTITGGRLSSDKNQQRWNDASVDNLTRLKDKYLTQLQALPKSDRRSQEEETLQADISDLNHRILMTQNELKALDRNIQSKEKELMFNKGQLKDMQPKHRDQTKAVQNLERELKRYQDAVNQVADQVFAAFCQRLGYVSIRDYESQQGTVQAEAAEKRVEFTKQRSRLENQIAYNETQLNSAKERITRLQERSQRDKDQVDSFNAEKEELQNNIDVLQGELEQLQETLQSRKEKLAERVTAVTEARRELDKRSGAVKEVMKAVDALEADIKRTAASRYALLRKCRVDEIKIPLEEGSASLNSLPMGDLVKGPDLNAMDVDEDPDVTQIHQPEVDDYGIEVDFEELDDDLKEDNSPACDTKLQETISTLTSEIEKSNPNMRAFERLDTTQEKLKSTEKTYEASRKAALKARGDFEDVKQKRLDLFQKAFNHISENIGGTYKDLTKSPQFPLGGQAYLDMEDSSEPYLAGLKYHAMPPLKRFRDMEHLSGGEKTIAALALLFAIHSYQPSPFFVLDEVDAALDNVNVGRVAKYVKEHASPGMQFIVISLKAGLFQESESLVGVMRDQSRMSSRVVSLDLRKYQPS